jgi:hypothetical protein
MSAEMLSRPPRLAIVKRKREFIDSDDVDPWTEWMSSTLVSSEFDLPHEALCTVFATEAVRLSRRVNRAAGRRLPRSLSDTIRGL